MYSPDTASKFSTSISRMIRLKPSNTFTDGQALYLPSLNRLLECPIGALLLLRDGVEVRPGPQITYSFHRIFIEGYRKSLRKPTLRMNAQSKDDRFKAYGHDVHSNGRASVSIRQPPPAPRSSLAQSPLTLRQLPSPIRPLASEYRQCALVSVIAYVAHGNGFY